MSEKTEQPTPKRIRDAREKGQVVKSQEINAVVQLGLTLLWLIAEGPVLYRALADCIIGTVGVINLPLDEALAHLTGGLVALTLRFVFGLAALLAVALTLTGLIQSGFLFSPKAIEPSAQRLSPLANAKEMLSLTKLFELLKSMLKVAVLGATFAYLIERYAPSFAHLPHAGLAAGLAVCTRMGQWMWAILVAVTVVFAAADYAVQYHRLRKQLMMSREDIKQEVKNAEGSEEIKQRRRELQEEVQSGSLADTVGQSSVVVRNPTHIAVCLRYKEGETPLPKVLEYGRDARAAHIVGLAEKYGVPVVENVLLARALVAATKPGDYIPEPLFAAVAQVLRLVQDQMQEDEDDEIL